MRKLFRFVFSVRVVIQDVVDAVFSWLAEKFKEISNQMCVRPLKCLSSSIYKFTYRFLKAYYSQICTKAL